MNKSFGTFSQSIVKLKMCDWLFCLSSHIWFDGPATKWLVYQTICVRVFIRETARNQ